ncbi:hypothetical protein B9Z55_025002 [Caenorhabditis nigoni]|uniref:Guanine nucleotide-binding protein subunit gamma n=1 Tax=Caenorhabditis nigoni TaxID=1611254 RepID=A0A2G5SWE9_9PELO|nr:hypothetical protein B9Z55_025002 [Caenorhabditis nigoni]
MYSNFLTEHGSRHVSPHPSERSRGPSSERPRTATNYIPLLPEKANTNDEAMADYLPNYISEKKPRTAGSSPEPAVQVDLDSDSFFDEKREPVIAPEDREQVASAAPGEVVSVETPALAPHNEDFQRRDEMENIKATTEQLRTEANIQRKKVSEVAKDLMEFCEKNKATDMLVSGPLDAHNPFQEKKSCSVL